jgi:hypothetical protein
MLFKSLNIKPRSVTQKLFKNKWQHQDPKVRQKAISSLDQQGAEIIQLVNDENEQVRITAIQHTTHCPSLVKQAESSPEVIQKAAINRLKELSLSPEEMLQAYPYIVSAELNQKIAPDHCYPNELRKKAIDQLDDQQTLFTIASTDESKEIQFYAAQQLSEPAQLKKLEKQARNNKRLRQLLKEKLEEEQQKAFINEKLDMLCKETEALATPKETFAQWQQAKTRLIVLEKQWDALNSPTSHQERFFKAKECFLNLLSTQENIEQQYAPLRKKQQAVLKSADTFIAQLQEKPEQFTAEELEQQLQIIEEAWHDLSTLPEPEQTENTQAFTQKQEHISSLANDRIQYAKQEKLLEKHCQQTEKYLEKSQITANRIKQFKNDWRKYSIPPTTAGNTLKNRFQSAIVRLEKALQEQTSQHQQNLKFIQEKLTLINTALEKEQLSDAIKYYQAIQQRLIHTGNIPKALHQHLQRIKPHIREAQDWRHWGSDKVREQLIDNASKLASTPLTDPIRQEKAIHQLRDEWRKLGKLDPQSHQDLWERFNAACTQAYEPCKQHHAQQAEQRNTNLQEREAICEALERLEQSTEWNNITDANEWRKINQTINQHRKAWKKTGTVDRKQWKTINERFNQAMDALEAHLAKEREHNFKQRQRLVEDAENLGTCEAISEAIEQAKNLQSRWQTSITSNKSTEQKLWKQFRAAIDAVFERQKEQQQANKQELNENIVARESILQTLTSWLELETNHFYQKYSTLEAQESHFNALVPIPRNKQNLLDKQFTHLKEQLGKRFAKLKNQEDKHQLALLLQKASLCSQQEQGNEVPPEAWDQLEKLKDSKLEQQMEQRLQHATGTQTTDGDHLLKVEILLDLPSPPALQLKRMEYQVAFLSEFMLAGDAKQEKYQQAVKLFKDYLFGAGNLVDDEQEERLKAIINAL